jgi:hypothetical protein
MGQNGGKRPGAGRKSKAEEFALAEKLKVFDEMAFKALEAGIKKKDFVYIKLFMEYRYGKPTETIKMDATVEQTVLKIGYGDKDAED